MNNYNNKLCIKEVEEEFNITFDSNYELLFSQFNTSNDGDCWVIYYNHNDNKLYEVLSSHDSTDNFNGHWHPEETIKESIIYRIDNKGHKEFNTKEVLKSLLAIHDKFMFDFDSIPTPEELAKITNIDTLFKDNNIIFKHEDFITNIKRNIVSAIKKQVFNPSERVVILEDIPLTSIAGEISVNNPSKVITYLNQYIQPIVDVLQEKSWDANFKVSYSNNTMNLLLSIEAPTIKNTDNLKKSTKPSKK